MEERSRAGLVMGLLALVVYALTLPAVGYNSDVYSYIVAIREGDPRTLFNPHHLLHGPTGYAWTRLLAWTGVPQATLLRSMSAVFGAAAVVAFWRIVASFLPSTTSRALATSGFAFCFAVWMFSVDVEVYVPSTAFLCFSYLVLAGAAGDGSLRRAAGAGLLMGAGTLYHQMGALFAVVGVPLLWAGPLPRERKLRQLATFWLSGGALTLLLYVWAAVALHGVRTARDFLVWILGYSLRGYGAGLSLDSLTEAILGHGRSLVFFEFVLKDLQLRSPHLGWKLGLVAVVALAIAAGALAAVRGWWRSPGARRAAPLAALVTWYLTFALFSLWWEPENPEFWVTAMVPFWALWAGGVVLGGGRWPPLAAFVVVVMFACNFFDLRQRRDLAYDPEVTAVRALDARLQPGDAVLLPPTFDAKAGVFAPRLGRIPVYRICKDTPGRADLALAELEERVSGTLRGGGRAFFYARAFSREVLNPHPWCREVEASFRARHRLVPAFELQLPVDDDESARDRRVARWQPITVYEVLAPE